jgi:hypothetical protein
MSFRLKNTIIEASAFANTAKDPMFDVNKLQNIQIDNNLDMVTAGQVLFFDGTEWTYANAIGPTGADQTSTTGPIGPFYSGHTGPNNTGNADTGPTGISNTTLGHTGPTGPGDPINGETGTTGFQHSLTGHTGPVSGINADTGPTGFQAADIGPTGATGPLSSGMADDGPTGPTGPGGVSKTGPTGASASAVADTGPSGPPGGGKGIDEHTGPTGPKGYLPENLLMAVANITPVVVSDNTVTTLDGSISFNTSGYYLIFDSGKFGVPLGLWKIVVDVEWSDVSGSSRNIEIVDANDLNSPPLATSRILPTGSSPTKQQLIYLGNFNNVNKTLQFRAFQNSGSPVNLTGTISLYSYTIGFPTGPTGAPGPINPGTNAFALRFVNHDIINPPIEVGIFYQRGGTGAATGYHMAPSGNPSNPIQKIENATGAAVSGLFKFNWADTDLPRVNANTNVREIILGGDEPILESMRIYIAKRTISGNPGPFASWTTDPVTAIAGGIPQALIQTLSKDDLTADFAEISYNVPEGAHTLFTNQSTVDGMIIPLTLTVFYKNNEGYRRMTNGPVGIAQNMQTLIDNYVAAATGTIFIDTLLPPSDPARLSAPQKLSATGPWNDYMDTYVDQVWDTWTNDTLSFYPIPNATFDRADITTDSTTMYINATGSAPFSFTVPKNRVKGYSRDILGQAGIWAEGSGSEKTVKSYVVTAFARGVAHLQGTLFDSTTIFKGAAFQNSVWNDWEGKGRNFYQNVNPHIYAKFLHDNSLNGIIDGVNLPFGYALSFDDVYNWSSEITSDPFGTSPTTDTQLERLVIDIYENDNL